MTTNTKKSPHYSPEREDRVAAALRENLRKRKQQQLQQVQKRLEKTDNSKD
jgi:hypothetical protein